MGEDEPKGALAEATSWRETTLDTAGGANAALDAHTRGKFVLVAGAQAAGALFKVGATADFTLAAIVMLAAFGELRRGSRCPSNGAPDG